MDPELRGYLRVIVVLLVLILGTLWTPLLISEVGLVGLGVAVTIGAVIFAVLSPSYSVEQYKENLFRLVGK